MKRCLANCLTGDRCKRQIKINAKYCKQHSWCGIVSKFWRRGEIRNARIKNVLLCVDRSDFIDKPLKDRPESIGFGATISAPHMHIRALNMLYPSLKPGSKALDIGCGSGYLVGCMALLVGLEGRVIGIEYVPELCEKAKENLLEYKDALNNIKIVQGDGKKGYAKEAPYDAIHVGATTTNEVAMNLCKQLKRGGKMVAPIRNREDNVAYFTLFHKESDSRINRMTDVAVRYVSLI